MAHAPIMRTFTDEEIITRVEGLSTFKGWPSENEVVDVWVRAKPDAANYDHFVDKVFTYVIKNGTPQFVMACTGTSNAGSAGLMHFDKYNREGCAVLASDTLVYKSHGYGMHKGKYPAYVERNGFPYYRDGNKNKFAEEIGPVHTDIIGANCHHAGMHSEYIGGWSVACLVRNDLAQFEKWMTFMAKRPTLSVAILKEF